MIGRPLFANLPDEYARLFQSYSECRLLKSGALAAEFDLLAGKMVGEERPNRPRSSVPEWVAGFGLFGRKARAT